MLKERRKVHESELTPLRLHERISTLEEHVEGIDLWRISIEENTKIQREVVEVGQAIIKGMGWVKSFVQWIAIVGGGFAALVVAVREAWRVL